MNEGLGEDFLLMEICETPVKGKKQTLPPSTNTHQGPQRLPESPGVDDPGATKGQEVR